MDDLLLGPLGHERGRPDAPLAAASGRTRGAAATLLLACCLLAVACGSDPPRERVGSATPATGEGGGIAYAVPALPSGLDPLTARGVVAATVSRQVHEPLVARTAGPYGAPPRPAGLATALRPSAGGTVWTVQLRPGVSFADGTPFNAAAVLVNSRRWRSTTAGRAAFPELFAVDSPRPGEVRFLLQEAVTDLPRMLADPRLAIVSPRALEPQSGEGARFRPRARGSGTGPFALVKPGSGELARNHDWWGSALGLGPALESVRFTPLATASARTAALRADRVQIAGPLPPASLGRLRSEPLLDAVPRVGGGVGIRASVRGLSPRRLVPLLSAVWLTTLTG